MQNAEDGCTKRLDDHDQGKGKGKGDYEGSTLMLAPYSGLWKARLEKGLEQMCAKRGLMWLPRFLYHKVGFVSAGGMEMGGWLPVWSTGRVGFHRGERGQVKKRIS